MIKHGHTLTVDVGDSLVISQKIKIPSNVVGIYLVDLYKVTGIDASGLSSATLGISAQKSDNPSDWLYSYDGSTGLHWQITTDAVHPYLGQDVNPGNDYYLMTKLVFKQSRTVTVSATDVYPDGGIHLCKNGVWSTRLGNIMFRAHGFIIEEEQPTYILIIQTIPTNCEVSVAGVGAKSSGTSGAMFFDLSQGTYSVVVSKSGYVSKTESVTISTSDVTKIITLQQSSRKLTIITIPSNCEVTVQNVGTKDSGTSGAVFDVTSGKYTVTVSKDEYITKTEYVTISTQDVVQTILLEQEQEPTIPSEPLSFNIIVIFAIAIIVVAGSVAVVLFYKAKRKRKKK